MRSGVLYLAGLVIAAFAFQQLIGSEPFVLDTTLMWFEPWRIPLSVVGHGSLEHLLGNLFSLVLFGFILERSVGSARMVALFVGAGLVVSIVTPFTPYDRVIGASGAIFALIGALVVLRPMMPIWATAVPLPMFLAGLVYVLIDLLGVLYPAGTANFSHLIGMAIGMGAGLWWLSDGSYTPPEPVHHSRDAVSDDALDEYERQVGLR
jgi:uncharacterized protein